jgi:hypothetical protein
MNAAATAATAATAAGSTHFPFGKALGCCLAANSLIGMFANTNRIFASTS